MRRLTRPVLVASTAVEKRNARRKLQPIQTSVCHLQTDVRRLKRFEHENVRLKKLEGCQIAATHLQRVLEDARHPSVPLRMGLMISKPAINFFVISHNYAVIRLRHR